MEMTMDQIWSKMPCGCKIIKMAAFKVPSILPCDTHRLRICPRRRKRAEIARRREWIAQARAKAPWRRR
jgi:hypothetical protein